MSKKNNIVSDNLRQFIAKNYGSLTDFAARHDIKQSRLSQWVNGRAAPPDSFLYTLHTKDGCNINWLLTGDGEMWADNNRGRFLKEKHAYSDNIEYDERIAKTRKWIDRYYDNLNYFIIELGIKNPEEWFNCFKYGIDIPFNFDSVMEKAGLNIKHFGDTKGEPLFSHSAAGRELYYKEHGSYPNMSPEELSSECSLLKNPDYFLEMISMQVEKTVRDTMDKYYVESRIKTLKNDNK